MMMSDDKVGGSKKVKIMMTLNVNDPWLVSSHIAHEEKL